LGDIVLVSRRDFQESKVDVVHKYEKDEPHRLLTVGEIPSFFVDGTSHSENNINDSSLLVIGEDEDDQTDDKINFDDI
jgi:translation initiation factor 1A